MSGLKNKVYRYYEALKTRVLHYGRELILRPKYATLPNNLRERKNVFLYFDYEREFGCDDAQLTDTQLYTLLQYLQERNLHCTFFTVGKVMERYAETVHRIQAEGHEVGSHTYGHIVLTKTDKQAITQDIAQTQQMGEKLCGFHYPQGQWNCFALKQIQTAGYAYDVYHDKLVKCLIPQVINNQSNRGGVFMRFQTINDDWTPYVTKMKAAEMTAFYRQQFARVQQGDVVGIGAHPWVLFSHPDLLQGYLDFIDELLADPQVQIKTAQEYYVAIKEYA